MLVCKEAGRRFIALYTMLLYYAGHAEEVLP